ncbi:MAG: hypothetical protein HQL32_04190, partial [Planctomycetes bacterium]|nr:hypothetical protein [Planctomycetota bacterium]
EAYKYFYNDELFKQAEFDRGVKLREKSWFTNGQIASDIKFSNARVQAIKLWTLAGKELPTKVYLKRKEQKDPIFELCQRIQKLLAKNLSDQENLSVWADPPSLIESHYCPQGGIKTSTKKDKAAITVDGQPQAYVPYNILKVFKDFKGKHPQEEGYYYFNANAMDGKSKLSFEYDSETRLVMEVYDWGKNGDKKVAVGFADGHVRFFDAPTLPASQLNLKEILARKGNEQL